MTLVICFAQSAFAQWTGNATILPTNSNASVGVGTTTPLARLHVKGAGVNLKLESTTTMNLLGFHSGTTVKGIIGTLSNANDMNFGTFDGNGSGTVNLVIGNLPKLTLTPSGFVGIGLTAPATTLHVKSAASDTMPLRIESGSSTINRTEYWLNNTRKGYLRVSTDIDFGTSSGGSNKLHFVTGGTRRLTVLPSSGNVGIGIQNPTAQLHVKGANSTPMQIESATSSNTMEYLTANVKKGYTMVNGTDMEFGTIDGNSAKLHLVTYGARQLTVQPNGKVGIGTQAPAATLHVKSANSTTNMLRLESGAASNLISFYTKPTPSGPVIIKADMGVNLHDWDIRMASDNLSGSINLATANPTDPMTATGNINLVTRGANRLTVFANGNVGIGTASDDFKLSVNGTIRSKEVRVESGWADYVFDEGYRLRPLAEVEQFIQANKHLPDVTPAADIQKDGLQVAKQMTEMMQKVEELTLYVIQLDKENTALKAQVARLEADKK